MDQSKQNKKIYSRFIDCVKVKKDNPTILIFIENGKPPKSTL